MKRYIGNTGEVYIVEDVTAASPVSSRGDTLEANVSGDSTGSILGNLFGTSRRSVRQSNLPFGIEIGDLAILALLFFLYQESGDEEFLIILACFALCILTR